MICLTSLSAEVPSQREAVKMREEVNLEGTTRVLLNVDPQETTKIVSEPHTAN